MFFKLITSPFFLAYLGAICAHILSLYGDNFNGTVPFLKKIIPKKSDTFHNRIDFLVLPFIGALLAVFLIQPTGLQPSFFAGLGWSGSLMAMLRRNNDQIEKSK